MITRLQYFVASLSVNVIGHLDLRIDPEVRFLANRQDVVYATNVGIRHNSSA